MRLVQLKPWGLAYLSCSSIPKPRCPCLSGMHCLYVARDLPLRRHVGPGRLARILEVSCN